MIVRKLGMFAAMAWIASVAGSFAEQLNTQQLQMIKDTAASICTTVKEAKGQKSDIQVQGDIKAELSGLLGKIANAGASGKGALTREEFEGLSRDATATALQGDRDCRERLFNKMFDKLSASNPAGVSVTGAPGGITAGRDAIGNTISNGPASGGPASASRP